MVGSEARFFYEVLFSKGDLFTGIGRYRALRPLGGFYLLNFDSFAASTRAGAIPFSMVPRPGFLFQGVPLSPSSDYFTV